MYNISTKMFALWAMLLGATTIGFSQPSYHWAVKAGATNVNDASNGLAIDHQGNSYIVGGFLATNIFGSSPNSKTVKTSGTSFTDGYLAKYDPAGNLMWIQTIVGGFSDGVNGVSLDDSDNVYITGYFAAGGGIGDTVALGLKQPNETTLTSAGGFDVFVAKYTSTGKLKWAVSAGDIGNESSYQISTDKNGTSTISGFTDSTSTFGKISTSHYKGQEAFIAQLDRNGNFLWANTVTGAGTQLGVNICTDPANNVYLTGRYSDTVFIGSDTIINKKGWDLFLIKYSSTGAIMRYKTYATRFNEYMSEIKADKFGHIYAGGSCTDSLKFDGITLRSKALLDGYIVKMDTALNAIWGRTFGTADKTFSDVVTSLDVTDSGNVMAAGIFASKGTFGSTTLSSTGDRDIFTISYDSSGTALWADQAGGSQYDVPNDIAAFRSTYMITGQFANNTTTATGTADFGSITLTSYGAGDIFLARADACPTPPVATFNTGSKTAFCTGDSLRLSLAPQSAGYLYSYTSNKVPQESKYDSFYYTKSSASIVGRVMDLNGCYGETAPFKASANAIPSATISPAGKQSVCGSDSLQLSSGTTGAYTYIWKLNGTAVSSATGFSYYARKAGLYTLTVTDGIGCAATSLADTVSVQPSPAKPVYKINGSISRCTGDTVKISTAKVAGVHYQWYYNSNISTGDSSTSFNATKAGTYSLTASSKGCITKAGDTTVSFSTPPVNTVSSSATKPLCFGDSITLTASNVSGYSYQWYSSIGSKIAGATTASFNTKTSGSYYVTIDNGLGCKDSSAPQTATIYPMTPAPSIATARNILTSTKAKKYQWYLGSSLLNKADSQSYVPLVNGSYKVAIIDSNGCSATSSAFAYTFTGISSISSLANTYRLYPNPVASAQSEFYIEGTDLSKAMTVEIRDLKGRILSIQNYTPAARQTVSLNGVSQGMYLISIKTADYQQTIRLIKE